MIYDVLILGSGPGGYVAGVKASNLGLKVAVVEEDSLGGVCLNYGCIPTKTLLKSSKVYKYISHSREYGVEIDGSVRVNWPSMITRKDQVVSKLTKGVETLLKGNKIDIIKGHGRVIDKNNIEVDGKTIQFKNLVLATGSKGRIPNIPGIEDGIKDGFVITSREALDLDHLPKDITILGGGVIGIEFATLFATLGSKVRIVQDLDKLLQFADIDIVKSLEKILLDLGVELIYNSTIIKIDKESVVVETNGSRKIISCDKVLISIGRSANLDSFKNLNLKISRGSVDTNENMETSLKGVYAIGDLNGKYNLAHVASAEGIVAIEHIAGVKSKGIDYNKIPHCIYSNPEVASIGYSEEVAKSKFKDPIITKFPLSANGKALAEGENTGFIKVIADKTYGEIIGAHIVAPNATDMIAEITTTMDLEGTVYELSRSVHPHPSLSEIVMEVADKAYESLLKSRG